MLTKRYFLSKHGCAKNQVDAELIVGILNNKNWSRVDTPEDADLIIINSCGFIEPAKQESLNDVIQTRELYPKAKILLTGCLAERYGEVLSSELPEADGYFGNGDISKISSVVDELFSTYDIIQAHNKKKPVWIYPQEGISCGARPEIFNYPKSIYIKITEGCNNCCTFCAIPLIRGRLRSRPVAEIVNEIKELSQKGFYEFNLIGQDLAAFQATSDGLSGLAVLLKEISKLEGDFRIRLLYIHPDNFNADILPTMANDHRFLPYFDLPFQSASAKILKAMNRRGNPSVYLELIKKIQTAFKNTKYGFAAIRTTFLTGFPGEEETDFQETVNFLKQAHTLWSGGFAFSQEDDTVAAKMEMTVSPELAEERKNILHEIQTDITVKFLETLVGKEFTVLIEELIPGDDTEKSFAIGRAWFQAPEVDGAIVLVYEENQQDIHGNPIQAGSLVNAKIEALRGLDLEASIC